MGSQFYLQSNSTSSTSLPQSRPTSRHQQPATSLNITLSNDFPPSPSSDANDSDTSLPFPAPLPRSDFLRPQDFDPSAYLSTVVQQRYQTLEDLRVELRTRVQNLNQELVELVNSHQEEFMGLGASLRGGEEKVEEVRVGVLGLGREVRDVRQKVGEREAEVRGWVGERRRCREGIEVGRGLLGFEEALGGLEGKVGIQHRKKKEEDEEEMSEGGTSEEDDEDDNEEGDGDVAGVSMSRLKRRVEDLLRIARLAERVGQDHPFIQAQRPRVAKCREVLLMDLNTCLKHLKGSETSIPQQKLDLLRLYREIKFGETNDEKIEWL